MEKQIIMTLVIATVMFAAASGAPPRTPRGVPVKDAEGNRTLCPYVVDVDEDLHRVPRLIKVIKCQQPSPRHVNVATHHHKHSCEDLSTHSRQRGRCVELRDQVLVYDKRERETRPYEVPVGCTCMFQEPDKAIDPEKTYPSPS